jgi:hypothetical protein
MVRSEGNISLENPVTQPGIDPGTVRLVAQRLNHYANSGHIYTVVGIYKYIYLYIHMERCNKFLMYYITGNKTHCFMQILYSGVNGISYDMILRDDTWKPFFFILWINDLMLAVWPKFIPTNSYSCLCTNHKYMEVCGDIAPLILYQH